MGNPVWDGYPPDRTKDGWHWLGQVDDSFNRHPTHWSAARQIWTQGGLCCGGSAFPSQMTQGYDPPVRWFGYLPELAVSNAMLAALEAMVELHHDVSDIDLQQRVKRSNHTGHVDQARRILTARTAIKLAKEG